MFIGKLSVLQVHIVVGFEYSWAIMTIHNTFAQNLSKIDAMINPLVVESFTLHEEEIYYRYNFVPNNFKECDKIVCFASTHSCRFRVFMGHYD
jgi:hypothetical protein